MNVVDSMSTLWSDRGDLSWAVAPSAAAGYLGWLNRGNLGDEAMFQAHRASSLVPLRRVPMQKFGWRLATRGRVQTLVLGGGTLLGRREWTKRIEQAIEALQPDRIVSLGVGVEEPEFALSKSLISEGELSRQVSLLKSFDRIGVRGPRSAASLASLGLVAEVLGDPALALDAPASREATSRPRILLSLANVPNGYTEQDKSMRMQVARAAQRVAWSVGGTLTGLAMEPYDQVALEHAIPSVEVWTPRSVGEVMAGIAAADLVIGERLHANVLAAAMGTKFLAIGYKPKTFDFVESLGAGSVIDSRAVVEDDVYDDALAVLQATNVVSQRVEMLAGRFREAARQELS